MAKFSAEEKLNAVKRYLNSHESQKTNADSIGVHKAVLLTWIKQFEVGGDKSF